MNAVTCLFARAPVAGHLLELTLALRGLRHLRADALRQGRYKSLMVVEGGALGHVCHYIHLNPVRARVVTVEELQDYRHSSLWFLSRPKQRPAFLDLQTALAEAGGLADTKAGWRAYGRYLEWQASDGPAGRNKAYVSMSRGWALGGEGFKRALVKDHAVAVTARAWEQSGAIEIRQAQWQELLDKCLKRAGKRAPDAARERKSAPWKVAIAAFMKQKTQVTNRWLCDRLSMGTPVAVSHHVGQLRRNKEPAHCPSNQGNLNMTPSAFRRQVLIQWSPESAWMEP